ncbi:unnamed protein product, partial [marine sediment metagenome]
LILEANTLITVKGRKITDKNVLHQYMEKIDFEVMKKTIGG